MEDFKNNMEHYLPFLEELRRRLYHGTILFVATFLIGFLSAGVILKRVLGLLQIDNVVVATSSPFQFIEISLDVGFFLAIMVSVPYIIYSFFRFALPALSRSEKVGILKAVPASVGLFVVGFSYGLFILYYALGFVAAINTGLGIANFWNIGQFLSQLLITSALLGLVFEFPLLLSLLIKLGITTPQALRNQRRMAYFGMLSLTALLPPTDGISLIAMTLPLVVLYEGTILFNSKK